MQEAPANPNKAAVESCTAIRVMRDGTDDQIDRCTHLFLEALGGLPTLYLQAGPSSWSVSHDPLLWLQCRERVKAACSAGQILVCTPKPLGACRLKGSMLLTGAFGQHETKDGSDVIGGKIQGILGIAIRAPPGYLPDGVTPSPTAYNHLLDAAKIDQRDKALAALAALSAGLLEQAKTTFRDSTYLSLLVVDPAFRGLGIGKSLFRRVAKEAEEVKSDMCWFTQSDVNEAMYKRWGGECVGREKLVIPGFEPDDISNQVWRMFVKRPIKAEGGMAS